MRCEMTGSTSDTERGALSMRRTHPPDIVIERWAAPCGWPLRMFRLTSAGPAKGDILFLGGRGDFFEKYLEAFCLWRGAGWNISGFDWRGQGGSGRNHAGDSCHIDDFETFISDLEAYTADWCSRTPGPKVAIGHSMGGHVLLRTALRKNVAFDGLVLLSPMLGIRAGPLRGKSLHALASIGNTSALRQRPIWTGARSPVPGRVTSCPERQADKIWWKSAYPELGRSGPTWGWLAAATRSIAELDKSLRDNQLAIPGLVVGAAGDPIVDPGAIRRSAAFLPTFEHALIHGAGHELLRERDGPRHQCLMQIEDFLNRLAS